ncbi:hypothetical protein BTA51_04260 [Hahella sp. CCB-MM4]|uniref:DUF2489 domain-containing protein n=1 Tax=Hahella sp. (strain CCB-MM4) TaxID=1926491 RepID=UPI000B9B5503|nr:DUF2489 domain-containing protein [Hahella sp. CCB-MM4]OZG74237.1 hypothetical protein BTA51_04260 [Hahella sp. CCB-MM4]
MSTTTQWIFILAGLAAILWLLWFIRRQHQKLSFHRLQEQEQQARYQDHRNSAIESIQVIARAMLAGQVELSEGCIRVKVLLDSVAPELHEDERFAVFNHLYSQTQHMPTHEARKEVDKRFLFKLDRQRWQLENDHKVEILTASKALLEHQFH